MKKIIVNGGEFYKLYQVYNATKNFSANAQTVLFNVRKDVIYRIEVDNTTDKFDLYNGQYLVRKEYSRLYVSNNKAIYTVRAYQDGVLYMRYANAMTGITITAYEVVKYDNFIVTPNVATAFSLNWGLYFKYMQPVPEAGQTYHCKFTTNYNGQFALYGSDDTVLISPTACTEGQTFELDYTAVANDGYMRVRSYASGNPITVKINKA